MGIPSDNEGQARRLTTHEHPNSPKGPSEKPLDVWLYIRILVQRFWLILICVALALMIGVLQLKQATPLYTATAVIKYEPRGQQFVDLGERSSILYQRDEIATAVQLVRSPSVAEAVLMALGNPSTAATSGPAPTPSIFRLLQNRITDLQRGLRERIVSFRPQPIDPEIARTEERVRNLLLGLQVVQRPNTKLIEVRYTSGSQLMAARIANEFCEQYIRSIDADRRQAVLNARTFLDQQIREAKERLNQAERAVFEFSGQADLRVLDNNLEILSRSMSELNAQIEQMRNNVSNLEAEAEATELDSVRALLLETDAYYSQLKQRQTELIIKKGTLTAENSADFPAVRQIDREIEGLQEQLRLMESQAAEQVAGRLHLARMQVQRLEERLAEQKAAVNELQEQMITYRVLTREVDAARTVFANLLDQYKRLEVIGETSAGNVTIVSRAAIPRLATSPNVTRTLGGWLLVGLTLGVGLVLALHFSDRTVKNPTMIEESLGLATLALVPSLGRKPRGRHARGSQLLDPNGHTPQTEAFHYLRTSIQYSSAARAPQVLLVTSCLPQEGKSTVAANLALFSAGTRAGRVLLVDADLKRPTVHRSFELSRMPGLSDVLAGQVSLDDAIKQGPHHGLDILPAGMATPSPINLLDSNAMGELLAELKKRYGVVILDTAPSHAMADTLVLAKRVDGVCLVVRQGRTALEILEQTVQKYREIGAPLLGLVYNAPGGRSADPYNINYRYKYPVRPASNDEVPVGGR
jgi:capsular exopolysaccharide synthesis family protein